MGLFDLFKQRKKEESQAEPQNEVDAARKATLENPDDPSALTKLAGALKRAGEVVEALKHFEKVTSLVPNDPIAHFNYAVTCEEAGDIESALRELARVVELDPEDALAYNHLGAIYIDQSQYAKAEEALRRAVELNPESAIAMNNLGVALKHLDRARDAAFYLDRALALDPSLAQAEIELAEVREKLAAEPKSGKFRKGLSRTKVQFLEWFKPFVGFEVEAGAEFYDGLLDQLVLSDVGSELAAKLIEEIRARARDEGAMSVTRVIEILRSKLEDILSDTEPIAPFDPNRLNVVMLVGVNGVGKTTMLAKIARHLKEKNLNVLIAAADTFRAAAVDQLKIWAERTGTPIVSGQQGADPAAVVFDAAKAAVARKADVLLIDTAGRLQTKKNLMEELKKIERTITKNAPDANVHHLLCLDANTGQNAISQVELFRNVCRVRGLIINKIDGTARGGAVLAIVKKHRLPILFLGVGENVGDIVEFDAGEFVKAWFSAG